MIVTILIVLLIFFLLFGGVWGYRGRTTYGYGPTTGFVLLAVVLLLLLVFHVI